MAKIEEDRVSLPFPVQTMNNIDGIDKNKHRGRS